MPRHNSATNWVDLLVHAATDHADQPAYTFLVNPDDPTTGDHLTYRGLERRARAIAAHLQQMPVKPQRALLLYAPGLDFITAFFGCLHAGITAVPLAPPHKRTLDRAKPIMVDADAQVVLTTTETADLFRDKLDTRDAKTDLPWIATDVIEDAVADDWSRPDVSPDTLALLQYTSGSTGMPRGVKVSHGNLIHNAGALVRWGWDVGGRTGVNWLPAYHDMGLIGGVLVSAYSGHHSVLLAPLAFLQKPIRWLRAISRVDGAVTAAPNFAFDLCAKRITPDECEDLDLSRWMISFNGAEPVRKDTIDRFTKAFAHCGFRRETFAPVYGLAEATLLASVPTPDNKPCTRMFDADRLSTGQAVPTDDVAAARELVSCGQCLDDQRLAIVDPDTLAALPDREIGEIWVAGPSVTQGYWNQPDDDTTFNAAIAGENEPVFMRTGDLGFLDEGELFVTGRLKDVIIIRGVNHYPADAEQIATASHPLLDGYAAAVFAMPDEPTVGIVVVHEIRRTDEHTLAQVIDAIRTAISEQADLFVEQVLLVSPGSVPRTTSGKVRRGPCRTAMIEEELTVQAHWRAEHSDQPAVDDDADIAKGVLERIRQVARSGPAKIDAQTSIHALGLDSLQRLELLTSLEMHFGGRFPIESVARMETCGDIIDAVRAHLGSTSGNVVTADSEAWTDVAQCDVSQFPEYVRLKQNQTLIDATGLDNPYFHVHERVATDTTVIDGRELINFASYNYLGLCGHPRVNQAVKDTIDRYGTSASASRLVSGERPIHRELEQAIAHFIGVDDALVFVGGHATNETTVGHLFGAGDLILHDVLAHNSTIQGSLLSGADRRVFPHNDWRSLDRLLAQNRHKYRRVLIAIEGVYSMDGDMPDLPRFVELKEHYKAMLLVDEAHALGVVGKTGRGAAEHFGIDARRVDIWMGTLSKALGSCGGFIAGNNALVEYLKYSAPGFVYSVGISPPNAAAALESLRLLDAEPDRVATLRNRAELFVNLAQQLGLNTGSCEATAVVPVIIGNSLTCLTLSQRLLARGINVPPILFPAVEESAARLRFFITAMHTEAQIRETVSAVADELAALTPGSAVKPAAGATQPAPR